MGRKNANVFDNKSTDYLKLVSSIKLFINDLLFVREQSFSEVLTAAFWNG